MLGLEKNQFSVSYTFLFTFENAKNICKTINCNPALKSMKKLLILKFPSLKNLFLDDICDGATSNIIFLLHREQTNCLDQYERKSYVLFVAKLQTKNAETPKYFTCFSNELR